MSMPKIKTPIRVLIVDDSRAMTDLMASLLHTAGDIQVVGTAANGEEGVRLVQRLHPDLVTMDIYMPKMNGAEAVREIMRTHPVPIIIVSANNKPHTLDLAFQALRAGALSILSKPIASEHQTCQEFVQAVRVMAGVPVIHHWGNIGLKPSAKPLDARPVKKHIFPVKEIKSRIRAIGIAASTGGPSTVSAILRNLPVNFPLPVVLVQHFSPGFATGLADWLGTQTKLSIELASHGRELQPGTLLLAPDDYHMTVNRSKKVELSKGPVYKGLRPSANPLFESLAEVYGSGALGIILTGMGDDGADGLIKMHNTGGVIIAQEKTSCVVYGMPREAVARGVVDASLTPEQIGFLLTQLVGNE
jgi:two-component system, chemotaxis family, protein-glutamate methylesterase/glutaminase